MCVCGCGRGMGVGMGVNVGVGIGVGVGVGVCLCACECVYVHSRETTVSCWCARIPKIEVFAGDRGEDDGRERTLVIYTIVKVDL